MPEPKRFLVTGSNGFVGRKLKSALLGAFPGAFVYDLGEPEGNGRLENERDLVAAARQRPDVVFHLAAASSVGQSINGAADTVRTNISGSIALAEAIRAHAPGATMVFASSGEAYGGSFVGRDTVTELDPLQPNTPYARTKAAGEWAMRDLLSDICPVISLRLFNHTGAGQDERFVLPSFANQIARIEANLTAPTMMVGNLAAERDFLHVDDVIDAYLAIAKRHDELSHGFEVYNVSSGVARKISDLLDALIGMAKVDIQIEIDPSRLRPSDIPRAVGNNDKFSQKWDWRPTRSVTEILTDVMSGARANIA